MTDFKKFRFGEKRLFLYMLKIDIAIVPERLPDNYFAIRWYGSSHT
jgi:hypothetical protein